MFRPSTSIAEEIDNLNINNRELTRLIRWAEEEIVTRKKLLQSNHQRLVRLFEAKAQSERMEEWSTKSKVVWAKRPSWANHDIDYRVVGVSEKQIRVGELESGIVSLYKPDGHPVGRSTSSAIDLLKTFGNKDA